MTPITFLDSKVLMCGILFFIAGISPVSAKERNVGIVNTMSGVVENYHEGTVRPEQMKTGSKIYLNDRLVTMKESKVQIVFRNDSVITLGPESELIVTRDVYDASSGRRETILSLVKGKVRSVIGRNYSQSGSKFEVHTATAIAGARGTENLVDSQQNPPKTTVYGITDTTFVRNSDDSVEGEAGLTPGKGANVLPGQPPQVFDFQFTDPAFIELLNSTTQQGGSDAENDLNMGALDEGPAGEEPKIEEAAGPSDFQREKIEEHETPPYQEETQPNPSQRDSCESDGYHGM